MPSSIAKIHDDLVSYYLLTGIDRITNITRDMFIVNKDNLMVNV